MIPTLGRIVLYALTEGDALAVNRRREDFRRRAEAGGANTGHVGHSGNRVREGDEFPAMVVAVWGSDGSVNLQVHLDGNDTLWATSRTEGGGPGCWHWPVREPEPVFTPVGPLQQNQALSRPIA